jgi:polysaccharide pyruvyl transferase WcaK-like protein
VGLNISGLLYSGGYSRDNMFDLKMDYRVFSHKLLVNLLEETDACICLVPHTYGEKGTVNSDPDACEQLYRKLEQYGDRIKLISGIYNQSEIKALIGQMDFFIGARMHSCIASLSQGIPTVGVAYSRKFVGVFETLKQSEMIVDARTCDEESGVDLVLKSYKARKDIRTQLAPEAERVRDLVAENFRSIREKYLNG